MILLHDRDRIVDAKRADGAMPRSGLHPWQHANPMPTPSGRFGRFLTFTSLPNRCSIDKESARKPESAGTPAAGTLFQRSGEIGRAPIGSPRMRGPIPESANAADVVRVERKLVEHV